MKPLSSNQKVFTWLGILNIDENASKLKKILQIMSSVGLIIFESCLLISSGAFIYINASTDLEVCLYAIFQIFALTGLIYMVISALIQRNKIAAMFQTLLNIQRK